MAQQKFTNKGKKEDKKSFYQDKPKKQPKKHVTNPFRGKDDVE